MEQFFATLAAIIESCLFEAYERSLTDWIIGDGEPESFQATLELEHDPLAPLQPLLFATMVCDAGELLAFFHEPYTEAWYSVRQDVVV